MRLYGSANEERLHLRGSGGATGSEMTRCVHTHANLVFALNDVIWDKRGRRRKERVLGNGIEEGKTSTPAITLPRFGQI